MPTWLLGLPWKWIAIGLLIASLAFYIWWLRDTVQDQERIIADQKNTIEVLTEKLGTCEGAVKGLQDQNRDLITNNENAIRNYKNINSTLNGIKNVPVETVKGVAPNETSDKIIDLYNDIIKPFRTK